MAKKPTAAEQERLDKLAVWAARNRGIQTKIANEMRPVCTPQFIHHCLMGRRKSKGGIVEKKLRAAGAPI